MAYFKLTGNDNKVTIINGNNVSKVVDAQNHRIVYLGASTEFHQVKETLDVILARLKGQ